MNIHLIRRMEEDHEQNYTKSVCNGSMEQEYG